MNWYPKLSNNGIICGDDYNWDSVKNAATDAAALFNATVSLIPKTKRFWKIMRNKE
jgi:hypothetical protein